MSVFEITLEDGLLTCDSWLRVVPGKRQVGAGHWQGQPVAVKLFIDPQRAKQNWQRELDGGRALAKASIPTATLAVATMVDGQGILATQWLESAGEVTMPQAVGALARLHRAGLVQQDPHLGNFLATADGVVACLDWGSIRTSSAPGLDNLAGLLAQSQPTEDDRLPELFALYTAELGRDPGPLETLRQALRKQRKRRMSKYLRKIFRDCTEFSVTHHADRFQVCRRDHQSAGLQALLDDPDTAMAAGTALKQGRTCTVHQVEAAGLPLVVKRYNIKSLGHRLHRAFRETRAARSWRNAHLLARLGIPTARPIALVEHRLGPLRGKAYFITETLTSARLDELFAQPPEGPALELAIEQMGVLFERLFAARLSHGDMKFANLFFDGAQWAIIDLDGLTQHRNQRSLRRAFRKDVARVLRNWQEQPEIQTQAAQRLAQFR